MQQLHRQTKPHQKMQDSNGHITKKHFHEERVLIVFWRVITHHMHALYVATLWVAAATSEWSNHPTLYTVEIYHLHQRLVCHKILAQHLWAICTAVGYLRKVVLSTRTCYLVIPTANKALFSDKSWFFVWLQCWCSKLQHFIIFPVDFLSDSFGIWTLDALPHSKKNLYVIRHSRPYTDILLLPQIMALWLVSTGINNHFSTFQSLNASKLTWPAATWNVT